MDDKRKRRELNRQNFESITIKILEENIGGKPLDMGLGLFRFDTKSKGNRSKKINKWDYIKLKSFCTAKETINKMKRQHTGGR